MNRHPAAIPDLGVKEGDGSGWVFKVKEMSQERYNSLIKCISLSVMPAFSKENQIALYRMLLKALEISKKAKLNCFELRRKLSITFLRTTILLAVHSVGTMAY